MLVIVVNTLTLRLVIPRQFASLFSANLENRSCLLFLYVKRTIFVPIKAKSLIISIVYFRGGEVSIDNCRKVNT